ncbi:MAG: glucokinase [Oceanospirillaceae bacterium]
MSFYALVGDIGGTNARFALVEKGSVQLQHIVVLSCSDFENFDDAFAYYYQSINVKPLGIACISFACPIAEEVAMTNNHWAFNVTAMQKKLQLVQFDLLNDFTAMAYGTLFLNEQDKASIQIGSNNHLQDPRLVIGPGTGLGVSGLVPIKAYSNVDNDNIEWQAIATEGGHVSFAPLNKLQTEVLCILQRQYSRVSVERLLSGNGILVLYLALCEIHGQQSQFSTPAEITHAAKEHLCDLAVLAINTFCEILGAVTGDMVLAQGARGGVYLCGGILPRIKEILLSSEFTTAMCDKGRFQQYLADVPVWLCDAQYPGLLGAAGALQIKK